MSIKYLFAKGKLFNKVVMNKKSVILTEFVRDDNGEWHENQV